MIRKRMRMGIEISGLRRARWILKSEIDLENEKEREAERE
jgi:hypothetical protein